MADEKKRLPVLRQTPEEESGEGPRPPWHWVGFGTCVFFGAWLLLQYAAAAVQQKLLSGWVGEFSTPEELKARIAELDPSVATRIEIAALALPLAAFLLAAFLGGLVVGRWGGDNAGVREAALGGFAGVLIALAISVAGGGGIAWPSLVLLPVAAGVAALGGMLGLRMRKKGMTPNMR